MKANRAQRQLRSDQQVWQTSTQRLAELEVARDTLSGHTRQLKREVRELESRVSVESPWLAMLDTNRLAALAPEMREQLLSELGLDWHSSDQWLIVSKATLASVRMGAIQRDALTAAACAVLAISPGERQQLDSALARVREAHANWARANVQRERASDDTLVRYTLPSDLAFAQGLTNDLFSTFAATLGRQRATLLERYSSDWVNLETGFLGGATNRLIVLRGEDSTGSTQLMYELNRGALTQGASPIRPGAYFPSEFRAIFPGGWPEVAQREGFELPEGFEDRSPRDTRSRLQQVLPKFGPAP